MRTTIAVFAVALASSVLLTGVPSGLGAAAAPLRQIESWALYDNFNAGPIDPNKWFGSESPAWGAESRRIAGTGLLRIRYTSYAGTSSNTGGVNSSFRTNFMNPDSITQIQATSRVQNWGLVGCPGNSTSGAQTRARIFGSFFNAGTPTPDSQLDDVLVQVMLRRHVSWPEFRAQAQAFRCTDATCSTSTDLPIVTLSSVNVGVLVTFSVIWDPANDRFIYQFEGNTPEIQTYVWSDTSPPSVRFKRLDVLNTVPNCTGLPRPSAFMSARFEDVYVNASAAVVLARGARDRGSNPAYDNVPR